MGATFERGEESARPTATQDARARCRAELLVTTGHTVERSGDDAIVTQYGGSRVRWRRESGTGKDAVFVRVGDVTERTG